MAAEIRKRFPEAEVTLIPSGGGRFEVLLAGAPVYEKSKTGCHAQPGEIIGLLEKKAK